MGKPKLPCCIKKSPFQLQTEYEARKKKGRKKEFCGKKGLNQSSPTGLGKRRVKKEKIDTAQGNEREHRSRVKEISKRSVIKRTA